MIPSEALGALAVLAERALVGRILLSFLPPGLPGRHQPRDLPATWGASHLLGSVALLFEGRLLERFGASLSVSLSPALSLSPAHAPSPGHVPPSAHVLLLAPWLLLAIVRWVTLPGAMVPRHEPLSDRPSPLASLLLLASAAGVVGAVGFRSAAVDRGTALSVGDSLALLALCAFGLAAARRAPLARAICVLALAAALAAAIATERDGPIPLALLLGGGASLAIPWLRRGDRRAAAITVVAFAGMALVDARTTLMGAAGLFALRVHTPAPSRQALALLALVLLSVCALAASASFDSASVASVLAPSGIATILVVALALASRQRLALARAARTEGASPPPRSIDSSRPQAALFRDIAILVIVLAATRSELASFPSAAQALLPLAPLLAVGIGLWLAPDELPLAAAAAASPEPSAVG